MVKLEFTRVYIICLFLLNNIDCGYSLEPPRGGSTVYPKFYVLSRKKNIWKISTEIVFVFFYIHLIFIIVHRRVSVMDSGNE